MGGKKGDGEEERESYLLNWTAVQQLWSVTVSFRCSAFNPVGGSVFRLLCTMISLDTTHVEESVVSLLVETVEDKSVGLSSAPSPIDHRVCSHPDVLFSAHTVPLANVVLKWLNRLSFRATSTLGFIRRVNLMGVVSVGLRGRWSVYNRMQALAASGHSRWPWSWYFLTRDISWSVTFARLKCRETAANMPVVLSE